MPRTKKQYEEIRENKKDIIIHAALHLFAEEGYHNTSISQIAKSAGISKGLMYNYFENKEQLLKAVIFRIFEQTIDIFTNVTSLDKNLVETILNDLFSTLKSDFAHWKLYMTILNQPGITKMFEEDANKIHSKVFVLLTDFYAHKGSKYPYAEAVLIHALMDGLIMNYLAEPEQFPIDDIKELIIEKFVL